MPVFVLLALFTVSASAARLDVVPTLSVEEIYTDNVSLASDALKESEWVTRVIPGISLAATGPRLRFNANYAPEFNYYARGSRDNRIYQRLDANGEVELAKQLFFVDARANIDQYNAALQGPITTSNVNTTGNLATVKTFLASPYLRHQFGSDLQAEARFTYTKVDSNSPGTLSSSLGNRADVRLNSGPAYKQLTWDLALYRETIDYELQQDLLSETIVANARQLITPTVGVLAKAGYEHYEAGSVIPATEGPGWGIGFDWTPTPRTRLAFVAGERLEDNAYSLDFNHRTRRTTWSVSYKEEVTTSRSRFVVPASSNTASSLDMMFRAQFPDPADRQKAVEQFIVQTGLPTSLNAPINFFSTELFLSKRWDASTGLLGARNVVVANFFEETRQRLAGNLIVPGTGDFALSNNIRQTGTSFHWNWHITALDSWNTALTYSRNEFQDIGRIDYYSTLDLGLRRQLQPGAFGSLNYRRQERESNQNVNSYSENAVFALFTLRF